jgi:hypothetical protein
MTAPKSVGLAAAGPPPLSLVRMLYTRERKTRAQEEILAQMTKDIYISLEKGWSPNRSRRPLARLQTELVGNQDAINRAQRNKLMLESSISVATAAEAAVNRYLDDVVKAKTPTPLAVRLSWFLALRSRLQKSRSPNRRRPNCACFSSLIARITRMCGPSGRTSRDSRKWSGKKRSRLRPKRRRRPRPDGGNGTGVPVLGRVPAIRPGSGERLFRRKRLRQPLVSSALLSVAVATVATICPVLAGSDMYESFCGLLAGPFSLTADPRFLFMTGTHRDAAATLAYAILARKGFTVLTGEAGAGKTTLLRSVLGSIPPTRACFSMVLNPALTVSEFLRQLKRIGLRFSIRSLALSEVPQYMRHRWMRASARELPFTPEAIEEIARLSRGIPRLINTICDTRCYWGSPRAPHGFSGGTSSRSPRTCGRRRPNPGMEMRLHKWTALRHDGRGSRGWVSGRLNEQNI